MASISIAPAAEFVSAVCISPPCASTVGRVPSTAAVAAKSASADLGDEFMAVCSPNSYILGLIFFFSAFSQTCAPPRNLYFNSLCTRSSDCARRWEAPAQNEPAEVSEQ
jgi:hypothetical protein